MLDKDTKTSDISPSGLAFEVAVAVALGRMAEAVFVFRIILGSVFRISFDIVLEALFTTWLNVKMSGLGIERYRWTHYKVSWDEES